MMKAEDIVRRLADPYHAPGFRGECWWCGAVPCTDDNRPEVHEPDCLYRLACEWVAEHGGEES